MPITEQQLLQITPNAGRNAGVFASALNLAMERYQINTKLRIASFIAQLGHESGHFQKTRESMNYSVEALVAGFSRTRISLADAQAYGRTTSRKADQRAIANCLYGGEWGRKNLGNTQPGDGWHFRGAGWIQETGRANLLACSLGLFGDDRLLRNPEALEQPQYAALSAAWHWSTNRLSTWADKGDNDNVGSIINTGKAGNTPKGAKERSALYEKALHVLS